MKSGNGFGILISLVTLGISVIDVISKFYPIIKSLDNFTVGCCLVILQVLVVYLFCKMRNGNNSVKNIPSFCNVLWCKRKERRLNKVCEYISLANKNFEAFNVDQLVEKSLRKCLELTGCREVIFYLKDSKKKIFYSYKLNYSATGGVHFEKSVKTNMQLKEKGAKEIQSLMRRSKGRDLFFFLKPFKSLSLNIQKEKDTIAVAELSQSKSILYRFDYCIFELIMQNLYSLIERKQATESFQKNILIYRSLFDTIPVMIFTTDIVGDITGVNPLWLKTLGYAEDEVLYTSSFFYLAPGQEVKALLNTEKLIREGIVTNIEYDFVCKSGKRIQTFFSATYIPSNYDNSELIQAAMIDITKVKQTENELREKELDYKSLFNANTDAILILSTEGLVLDSNTAFDKMFGYSTHEVVNRSINFLFSSNEYYKKLISYLSGKLSKKESSLIHCQLIRKDGRLITGELSLFKFRNNPESTPKVACFIKDVTGVIKLEQDLKRLHVGVEQSASMILITDTSGSIVYANRAFCTTTGYKKTEVVGHKSSILKSGYHDSVFYQDLWSTIKKGKAWRGDICNKKKNGDIYWESALITPIRYRGTTLNYLAVKEDITLKKQEDKRMLNAIIDSEEQQRKIFAEDLHDELGPHLSSIRLFINELEEESISQDRKKELVKMLDFFLKEAIDKIRTISNQLMPNILMNFGLITAIESFVNRINQTGALQIVFYHNKKEINLDKTQEIVLYRVLMELVNNTIKHAKATEVKLKIIENKKNVLVKFEDDGGGFDFVEQLHKQKGVGLKNITNRIKVLNGTYSFDSTPQNGFSITIKFNSDN